MGAISVMRKSKQKYKYMQKGTLISQTHTVIPRKLEVICALNSTLIFHFEKKILL